MPKWVSRTKKEANLKARWSFGRRRYGKGRAERETETEEMLCF